MGLLFGQRLCLLLGLLRLCLNCLGRNLRLGCFRFRRHRLNTSFHWLSQPTATFCAASWISQSPNWLEVVSQSAQYGNGTAKPMPRFLHSITVVLRIIQTPKGWRWLRRLGYQAPTLDKGRGHIKWPRCEPTRLGFAYAEYLGSAFRAHTLSRRTLVLHDDLLWTLDLNLALALHAVSLCHCFQPPFR